MLTNVLPDGTHATTPMIAGSQENMQSALDCDHDWRKGTEWAAPPEDAGSQYEWVCMDRCTKCVAIRGRMIPPGVDKPEA